MISFGFGLLKKYQNQKFAFTVVCTVTKLISYLLILWLSFLILSLVKSLMSSSVSSCLMTGQE